MTKNSVSLKVATTFSLMVSLDDGPRFDSLLIQTKINGSSKQASHDTTSVQKGGIEALYDRNIVAVVVAIVVAVAVAAVAFVVVVVVIVIVRAHSAATNEKSIAQTLEVERAFFPSSS